MSIRKTRADFPTAAMVETLQCNVSTYDMAFKGIALL
jgi:hypothetical protein